jgi:hypothetical protein
MKSTLHVENNPESSSVNPTTKSSQITNISKEMARCQGKRAGACSGHMKKP